MYAAAVTDRSAIGFHVGHVGTFEGPHIGCLPLGTRARVIAEVEALETDPSFHGCDEVYPIPVLTTVQVVD